jgi:hypothetical protein
MNFQHLPTFYIIGAPKAGTTTLYDTLVQYPQVYFPVQKEPSFFCDEEYYQKGIAWYQDTFYPQSQKYKERGDATPRYLYWGERVAPRIASLYGNTPPRFIAIFREPSKLVYSYYWQNVREGREEMDFRSALQAEPQRLQKHQSFLADRGRIVYAYSRIASYASQLKPFLDRFPRDRFLFLLTDDLKDFQQVTGKLEGFLELTHQNWDQPVRSNVASIPRSRRMHQWLIQRSRVKEILKNFVPYSIRYKIKMSAIHSNLREIEVPQLEEDLALKLKQHYLPEVRQLEEIIDRDLSSWYPE